MLTRTEKSFKRYSLWSTDVHSSSYSKNQGNLWNDKSLTWILGAILGIGFPYLGDLGSLESTFFPPTWRKKIVTFAPRGKNECPLISPNQNLPTVNFAGNIPSFFSGRLKILKKNQCPFPNQKQKKTKKCSSPPKCVEKTLLQGFLYIASLAGGHPSWIHQNIFFRQWLRAKKTRPPGLPTTYWPKAVQKRPSRKKMAP